MEETPDVLAVRTLCGLPTDVEVVKTTLVSAKKEKL